MNSNKMQMNDSTMYGIYVYFTKYTMQIYTWNIICNEMSTKYNV